MNLKSDASEVQGEGRAELVRALLSRSLHSPLQPVCDGKVTAKSAPFQIFRHILPRLVATAAPSGDKQPSAARILSQDANKKNIHLYFYFLFYSGTYYYLCSLKQNKAKSTL